RQHAAAAVGDLAVDRASGARTTALCKNVCRREQARGQRDDETVISTLHAHPPALNYKDCLEPQRPRRAAWRNSWCTWWALRFGSQTWNALSGLARLASTTGPRQRRTSTTARGSPPQPGEFNYLDAENASSWFALMFGCVDLFERLGNE